MVLGCSARAIHTWVLASALLTGLPGCSGQGGESPDERVVAVVDGTPITERELDAGLGSQLRDLERSRYHLRLQKLQHLIAERVLGTQRAEREGEQAFAAALAEATVEVRLAPPEADEHADQPVGEAAVHDGTEATAKRSALPVTLVGTIVRDDAAKSMAALRLPGALLARNIQPGQTIIDGAVLVRVERNRILVRHNGTLEFIPLSVGSEASTPTPARTLARFTRAPDRVLSLRRGDIDRALRDTTALEQSLTRAEPELDGRRLLVLGSIDAGSLYDLLQLQERDVLMQVNGEWVDDRRNPLWDALRADGTVTLLVMRAGQPQSFAYEIN